MICDTGVVISISSLSLLLMRDVAILHRHGDDAHIHVQGAWLPGADRKIDSIRVVLFMSRIGIPQASQDPFIRRGDSVGRKCVCFYQQVRADG